MKRFQSWSAGAAAIALMLVSAPVASTAMEQPIAAQPTMLMDEAPAPVSQSMAASLIAAVPVPEVPAPPVLVDDIADLDPGEFVWRPELSPTGEVEMVVSIPQQIAYVYRGGALIGVTTVSTGRPGHATPTGSFPILEKRREHYSNLYNNAPMPFMQRLTWDGIALHEGVIPGRPASHGCVRLPREFARALFGATRVGATVHIVDSSPTQWSALAEARGEMAPGAGMRLASR